MQSSIFRSFITIQHNIQKDENVIPYFIIYRPNNQRANIVTDRAD